MADFERIPYQEYDALDPEAKKEYERREELDHLEVAVEAIRSLALAIRPLEESSQRKPDGLHVVRRESGKEMLTAAGARLVRTCLALAVEGLDAIRASGTDDGADAWWAMQRAYIHLLAFDAHPADEVVGPTFGLPEDEGVWNTYERLAKKLEEEYAVYAGAEKEWKAMTSGDMQDAPPTYVAGVSEGITARDRILTAQEQLEQVPLDSISEGTRAYVHNSKLSLRELLAVLDHDDRTT